MNAPINQLGKNLCTFIFIAIFICCLACRNAQTEISSQPKIAVSPTAESQKVSENRKWIPGSYESIEIGKSTRKDVIEKFGNPIWEGEEELEGENKDIQKQLADHNGKRFMLEYRNIEVFDGRITFLYGERDKIIRAISLYPKDSFSKEVMIKKYGDDFIELNSNEKICSAINSSRKASLAKKDEMPATLIYPQLGVLISLIEASQTVDRIDYLLTCNE